MASNVKPRRYDSTNRRRQAAQTRRRILEAAQDLFVQDGYVATTMAAIAERAGVAVQTVYASTTSKRDILKGILDLAVSGDVAQVPVQASSQWKQIEAERDPGQRLRMFVELHTEICGREAPAFAIMSDAAGSDPEIRALMHDTAERRYRDQHQLATSLHRQGHLRSGLSARRAADIIWTLASERTYLALVSDRNWRIRDYRDWLTQQLIDALLAH
jgi:AcrR family transcriptional regulator